LTCLPRINEGDGEEKEEEDRSGKPQLIDSQRSLAELPYLHDG
jgi:hypothetical protein